MLPRRTWRSRSREPLSPRRYHERQPSFARSLVLTTLADGCPQTANDKFPLRTPTESSGQVVARSAYGDVRLAGRSHPKQCGFRSVCRGVAATCNGLRVPSRVALVERYQKGGVRRPGLWGSCDDCRGAQADLAGRWRACRGERSRYPLLHALGRAGPRPCAALCDLKA